MYRGNSTRVFPIILIIIIIALIVTALVSAIQSFVGSSDEEPAIDPAQATLFDTSGESSVRATVRGPIVSDEKFRSYRIVISPSSRSLTTYAGYLDQVLGTNQYGNNVRAYDEFVHALDKANMIKGEAFEGEKDDTRGICASGKVYEFEVLQANNVVKRLWTSTCKGSPGSFKASVNQVHGLFTQQIPDAKDTLREIDAI